VRVTNDCNEIIERVNVVRGGEMTQWRDIIEALWLVNGGHGASLRHQ
jgi:hypothetical protein